MWVVGFLLAVLVQSFVNRCPMDKDYLTLKPPLGLSPIRRME